MNGKRTSITLHDVCKIALDFTIKIPEGFVKEIQSLQTELLNLFKQYEAPKI